MHGMHILTEMQQEIRIFANEGRTKGKDPFADHGDGTGPYAVIILCMKL